MRSIILLYLLLASGPVSPEVVETPLPQFTGKNADLWLNSAPLQTADLRGKVVLLQVWTFGCSNCYRSIPWLKAVEKKYGSEAFAVIGIHTPEFEHEKLRGNIEKNLRKNGLKYPVMIDNDFAYWRSLANRYWPTFYVVDKKGIMRGVYVGETHRADPQAEAIERHIADLLTH